MRKLTSGLVAFAWPALGFYTTQSVSAQSRPAKPIRITPVALVASVPNILVGHPKSEPVKWGDVVMASGARAD